MADELMVDAAAPDEIKVTCIDQQSGRIGVDTGTGGDLLPAFQWTEYVRKDLYEEALRKIEELTSQ